jgi:hypothetical protein
MHWNASLALLERQAAGRCTRSILRITAPSALGRGEYEHVLQHVGYRQERARIQPADSEDSSSTCRAPAADAVSE